jgi:hypothetical protein
LWPADRQRANVTARNTVDGDKVKPLGRAPPSPPGVLVMLLAWAASRAVEPCGWVWGGFLRWYCCCLPSPAQLMNRIPASQ